MTNNDIQLPYHNLVVRAIYEYNNLIDNDNHLQFIDTYDGSLYEVYILDITVNNGAKIKIKNEHYTDIFYNEISNIAFKEKIELNIIVRKISSQLVVMIEKKERRVIDFFALHSKVNWHLESPLSMAIGEDILGNIVTINLQDMPHFLVGGTTGSGKSVGLNVMILSLLLNNAPNDLKLLLIDPKMVEFNDFNGIPHLLMPVINFADLALLAMDGICEEMQSRYSLLSKNGCKSIDSFNVKFPNDKLPKIVIFIDEFAGLVRKGSTKLQSSIQQIAQLGRACGIHMVIATQRPSREVICSVIKANLPSKICFTVSSKINSRVVLDCSGGESLRSKGDMYFLPTGVNSTKGYLSNDDNLHRIHGAFVDEKNTVSLINQIKLRYDFNRKDFANLLIDL